MPVLPYNVADAKAPPLLPAGNWLGEIRSMPEAKESKSGGQTLWVTFTILKALDPENADFPISSCSYSSDGEVELISFYSLKESQLHRLKKFMANHGIQPNEDGMPETEAFVGKRSILTVRHGKDYQDPTEHRAEIASCRPPVDD